MASSYDNDLRLEEMGTGEQVGSWGTKTNTNLSLIAEAFSYQTEATFSSDADVTATIADGATDKARAFYLKVTSSATLTATRTLTIAPNTLSKVIFIENATSGSQSIAISQGSGANVTIPNGSAKAVIPDGTGSGAAVFDILDKIDLGSNATKDSTALVSASSTNTFTNKTFDADGTGNSITNIENADIKSAAAIDASKIANGNVSSTEFQYLDGVTSAIQTQIDAKTTLSAVYPVGSIYINATNSTNPATLLGFGTWTAFGAGKVMVGLDSGDTDFDTAEETGGSKTSALPNHTHQWYDGTRSGSGSGIDFSTTFESGSFDSSGNADNFSGDPDTGDYYTANPSSSPNISTVQPYITVYMWKRTA